MNFLQVGYRTGVNKIYFLKSISYYKFSVSRCYIYIFLDDSEIFCVEKLFKHLSPNPTRDRLFSPVYLAVSEPRFGGFLVLTSFNCDANTEQRKTGS